MFYQKRGRQMDVTVCVVQAPELVEETFYEVGKMTGRDYKLFSYHGSPTAERVAVCMGSASKTLEETVDYMNQHGENVGMLNVHLFRPWSTWHFLNELPKTATKLAVLDKTREEGNAIDTPSPPFVLTAIF